MKKTKTKYSLRDAAIWVRDGVAPIGRDGKSSVSIAMSNLEMEGLVLFDTKNSKWVFTEKGKQFISSSDIVNSPRLHNSPESQIITLPQTIYGEIINDKVCVHLFDSKAKNGKGKLIGFVWEDKKHSYRGKPILRFRLIDETEHAIHGNTVSQTEIINQLLRLAINLNKIQWRI